MQTNSMLFCAYREKRESCNRELQDKDGIGEELLMKTTGKFIQT